MVDRQCERERVRHHSIIRHDRERADWIHQYVYKGPAVIDPPGWNRAIGCAGNKADILIGFG